MLQQNSTCRNSRIIEYVLFCSIFLDYEDVSFTKLVEFQKIVFFGSIHDFSELLGFSRRSPKVTEDVPFVELVRLPNIDFLGNVHLCK